MRSTREAAAVTKAVKPELGMRPRPPPSRTKRATDRMDSAKIMTVNLPGWS
eukprot:jgi/Psemu1/60368/gm1.60368_g